MMRQGLNSWLMLVVLMTGGGVGFAQQADDADLQRRWRSAWQQYRRQFAKVGETIYCAPRYNVKYDNSNHENERTWQKANSQTLEFDLRASWIKSRIVEPTNEEAEAYCKLLPDLNVGSYGYIQSAKVHGIVDADTIIITDIDLVDEKKLEAQRAADQQVVNQWIEEARDEARQENYQRWHQNKALLRGPSIAQLQQAGRLIDTTRYGQRDRLLQMEKMLAGNQVMVRGVVSKPLKVGQTWQAYGGQQLVIIGQDRNPAQPNQILPLAIYGKAFKSGISEQELEQVLTDRGMDKQQFVALVEMENQRDKDKAPAVVLGAMGFAGGADASGQIRSQRVGQVHAPGVGSQAPASNSPNSAQPSGGNNTTPKTHEQLRAMSPAQRRQYLMSLTPAQRAQLKQSLPPRRRR